MYDVFSPNYTCLVQIISYVHEGRLAVGLHIDPECHATARGSRTVPNPPHTALLGVDGERRGPNAKLGERGAGSV